MSIQLPPLPPGYEYLINVDYPLVAVVCADVAHEGRPWFVAFYGKVTPPPPRGQRAKSTADRRARWELLPPRRLMGNTRLWTPDLQKAVDGETRYNLPCRWRHPNSTVPIRNLDRLHRILDAAIQQSDMPQATVRLETVAAMMRS